ncbi:MAG: hypothetical protein V4726_16635 [Verrucomicrobiota bacterium]
MKLPRFPVLLLAASALFSPAKADDSPPAGKGNIHLQTTTFTVTGTALPLSLLNEPVSGDEALFLRLAAMVADGGAELASDQHLTMPTVKEARAEAIKEIPYPSDWTPLPDPREIMPKEFETTNTGISVNAQLDFLPAAPPNARTAGIFGSLSIKSIRMDHLGQVPVSLPQSHEDGAFNHPRFPTESINAVFRTADSAHHLISVCRQAGETVPGNDVWSLTFAKATPQSPDGKTAAAASGSALRLQALTFRLPVADGREFLKLHAAGKDGELLAVLLKSHAEKKAELTHLAALLVEAARSPLSPDGASAPEETEPEGLKTQDPFAIPKPGPQAAVYQPFMMGNGSGGDRTASVECMEEFPFATEYTDELVPKSFENKNIGRSFLVSVVRPMNASGARIAVNLEHWPAPDMVSWPEMKEGQRGYRTWCASFSQTSLTATLTVRPGGVYCLGAITLPEYFKDQRADSPLMEISLLKVAGTGSHQNPALKGVPPEPELEAEVFSLNADDAARLETLRHFPAETEALLSETTGSGRTHSVAFCLVPGDARSKPEIVAMVETAVPLGAAWTKTGRLLATEIEFHNIGFSLKTVNGEPPTKGETFLGFQHADSTITQPTQAELKKAADGDRKLPRHQRVEMEPDRQRFMIESNLPFPAVPFQILSLAPARVPAGHPEEGRWHAAVVRGKNP